MEDVRKACFHYDDAIGRLTELRGRMIRSQLRSYEEEGVNERLNELSIFANTAFRALEDSLHIFTRNCSKEGVDDLWVDRFETPNVVSDWAIHMVASRKKRVAREIRQEQKTS